MEMRIYNTMTRQKEPFEPLTPGQARMYVCGITAYDLSHIGHARSTLVFDVIRRYLEFKGYKVQFIRNFTDVDDKIIKKAEQESVSAEQVSERYIAEYQKDMGRLGILPATVEPKATEYIPQMIALIERLVARGFAYVVDGDVYFEIRRFPRYGRLSGKNLDELLAGARVEVDERKRDPHDFALWKSAKPGEPSWPSPWGPGRPGWHIECSAMSMEHLGESFDIHGGGEDLIFPHHDCEIAQSEAATDRPFVRYWIHNGFVQINQEKMSKSLGNIFNMRDIFEKSPYQNEQVMTEKLRYFLLTSHYRSPLDFSDQGLQEAKGGLDSVYELFQRFEERSGSEAPGDTLLRSAIKAFGQAFEQLMDDDFNTAAAIGEFQRLRGELNGLLGKGLSQAACQEAREAFRRFGHVLGLFRVPVKEWEFDMPPMPAGIIGVSQAVPQIKRWHPAYGVTATGPVWTEDEIKEKEKWIEEKLAQRNQARQRKDFGRADEIRAELAKEGITIEDR
ncbi:MAG: cysteine--tRNA ligase [Candidatus Methylomirabilales bacterium]